MDGQGLVGVIELAQHLGLSFDDEVHYTYDRVALFWQPIFGHFDRKSFQTYLIRSGNLGCDKNRESDM
jgi:hypothetical protein